MTYGLDIRTAQGLVTYSSTDVTWNQVDFFQCAAGQTVSNYYPVLEGREVLVTQVMIDPPPIDRKAIAHTITVNDTQVVVGGGSENTFVVVLMR